MQSNTRTTELERHVRSQRPEECSFCQEISRSTQTVTLIGDFFTSLGQSRILFHDSDFFVVPSIGPLVCGHILLLPVEHYFSIAEMPSDLLSSFATLVDSARRILRKQYGKRVLLFEHGCTPTAGKAGACIDHAHLHMLPFDMEVNAVVERHLGNGQEVETLQTLKQFASTGSPYVFFQTNGQPGHAYQAPTVPSQYFRQVIWSVDPGPRHWDWKRDFNLGSVRQTISDLSTEFRALQEGRDGR